MRVAIYGGSFNPPHVGHGMVASWLRWTDQVDAVWLVPTYDHAFGKALAPFERRVALCGALAEAVGPWVKVCTIEAELPTPSYTIDTLNALVARDPHDYRLVVGADVLDETDDWKDWDRIEEGFSPIVVGRLGYPEVPGAVTFPEVSSTAIRAARARGDDVRHWLPKAVHDLLGDLYTAR